MTATDNDNNVDVLARSGIFRDLPGEVLAEIAKAVRPQMVPPQTLIFGEGDPGDSLYIICSGRVRVFRSDESGLEIDLAVQGPGEAFGEISLLSGEPRSACVQVLEETHLLVLSKDDFDRILRKFPATSRVFFREMRRRLLRDEERLEGEVRESYKASRVSWFDFVVVLGVSVLLAMIFNSSNPNGIPILPAPPQQHDSRYQRGSGDERRSTWQCSHPRCHARELLPKASYPRFGQYAPGALRHRLRDDLLRRE